MQLMARTIRSIRDEGAGVARRLQSGIWQAGSVRLNGQAVADLIADGWLAGDDTGFLSITAYPAFAHRPIELAPRDGSPVTVLHGPEQEQVTAYWNRRVQGWLPPGGDKVLHNVHWWL